MHRLILLHTENAESEGGETLETALHYQFHEEGPGQTSRLEDSDGKTHLSRS